MSEYATMADLVRDWEAGKVNRGDVVAHAMSLVTPANADEILDAIPAGVLDSFLRWADDFVSRTPEDEVVSLSPLPPLPMHPDAAVLVRRWLARRGHVAAA